MKLDANRLEGFVLAAIVLVAASSACATGSAESDSEAGTEGFPTSGPGSAASDDAGSGDDRGGPALDAGTDTESRTMTFDTGAPDAGPFADDASDTPVADASEADAAAADLACGKESTQSACADCCASDHPSGISTLNSAIVSCACGTTGPCASACATEVCVDVPATSGDACYTCLSTALSSTGPCDAPVDKSCMADPGCAAYLSCESAQCSSLP
jgi:hypothetical protein